MKLIMKRHARPAAAPSAPSAGFTIVELMIATLVFSVVLVLLTTGVVQVTRRYYQGITLTNTQNTARGILNAFSQTIQFNGGKISWPAAGTTSGRGCLGSQQYDFQLGVQLADNVSSSDQATRVITQKSGVTACTSVAGGLPAFPPAATELLSPHMRLNKLDIVQVPGSTDLFRVSVTVVYGDYDLLCSPSVPTGSTGSCAGNSASSPTGAYLKNPDLTCRTEAGSQFCGVSALSTIVQERIVPSV